VKGKISALPGIELRFSDVSTRSLIAILTRFTASVVKVICQWRTQEFCSRGFQQIQLRTEDRENGDLGAVTPYSGVLEAAVIWYRKFRFM